MDDIFKPKFNKEKNDFIFVNLKRKCSTAMLMLVIFVFSVTTAYAGPSRNYVTVTDGESKLSFYTVKSDVESILKEKGITLSEYDEVVPAIDTAVYDDIDIKINRFKKVTVCCDGFYVSYYTKAETYREFIDDCEITLSANDIVDVNLDDKLQKDNEMSVTRVSVFKGEISEEIPFTSNRVEDYTLAKGKTNVVQKGQNGVKKINCEIVYNDGVEISKNIINEYVEKYPVNEIIAVGAAPADALTATVGDHTFIYKKLITCSATAYDLSFQSTGKYPGHPAYGITASGTYAKKGTVAVDPRVIPLGTKMYIVSTDGKVVYGYCTAEDTGGAIKGNKVDLFYNTTSECMQFGRRSVYVYIL